VFLNESLAKVLYSHSILYSQYTHTVLPTHAVLTITLYSLAKECYFLNADDLEERNKFLTAMTLQLQTHVFGPQEIVIKQGDRMQCVYLVRHGLAFGGKGNFGKVYTVGRWFGAEGLLVDRR
jgi:hypothetical protein